MTKEKYIEFCESIIGTGIDQPFKDDFLTFVARHKDSRKWFSLIMEHDGKVIVNLKCEPMQADFFRSVYQGVIPGYHMNKAHWNTVYLDSDVPDEIIEQMTLDSFNLTDKNSKLKSRKM